MRAVFYYYCHGCCLSFIDPAVRSRETTSVGLAWHPQVTTPERDGGFGRVLQVSHYVAALVVICLNHIVLKQATVIIGQSYFFTPEHRNSECQISFRSQNILGHSMPFCQLRVHMGIWKPWPIIKRHRFKQFPLPFAFFSGMVRTLSCQVIRDAPHCKVKKNAAYTGRKRDYIFI